MELTALLRALFRRWWLSLPLLAATGAATYLAWTSAESVFTAELPVLLEAGVDNGQANAPTVSGVMVTALLESDEVREEVDAGAGIDYEVTTLDDPAGTLVTVDVIAPTPVGALEVANALLGRIPSLVAGQEARLDVPAHAHMTFQPISSPLRAEEIPPEIPPGPVDPAVEPPPPTYRAGGVTLLKKPDPVVLAALPPNLATLRHLSALMATPEVLDVLQPEDSTKALFSYDPRDSVPLFLLEVQAPTRKEAADLLDLAVATASNLLDTLQAGMDVPPDARTVLVPLAAPPEPLEDTPRVNRAVVGVLGLGLLATVSLTVAIDGLILDRARRRRDAEAEVAADISVGAVEEVHEVAWPAPDGQVRIDTRIPVSTE